ncbi:UNVERIFIED_CONTAM: hypothetical protein Sradi_4561500 [Sesamum radiatum]|uniref:Reverse transcriptase n=1 Tax=Sesamum radiatum TaxID=300843 RepID=A0AAW2NAB1_SESRA
MNLITWNYQGLGEPLDSSVSQGSHLGLPPCLGFCGGNQVLFTPHRSCKALIVLGYTLGISTRFLINLKNWVTRPAWQIQRFREALSDCELVDLGFSSDPFTWSNRDPTPNTVWERLHRACANIDWIHRFPTTSVSHIPLLCSDHKVVLVGLKTERVFSKGKSKPWRFEGPWLQSPQCEHVVEKGWQIPLQLGALMPSLLNWNTVTNSSF